MAYLLVLVLHSMRYCPSILDAWEDAGVSGITILESSGLGTVRRAMQDDMPLFPSLHSLFSSRESHHRTLFTILPDDEAVDRVIAATEREIGDLSRPDTGLLFVLPVGRVLGLDKAQS